MTWDREAFAETVRAKREDMNRAMLPQARQLHASAVSIALLTGDDHWDRYQGMLQGMRDRILAMKQSAETKQADPAIWDSKDLFKLKSDVLCADRMLELLDTIMQLPKALKEGGEKALELIHKYEAQDGTTDTAHP